MYRNMSSAKIPVFDIHVNQCSRKIWRRKKNWTLERGNRREWEVQDFLISLSLQRRTIVSRGIRSKRKNSSDEATLCSRTLHTVTDKIGSRRHPNEEAKHRGECRSRRRLLEWASRILDDRHREAWIHRETGCRLWLNHVMLRGICHVPRLSRDSFSVLQAGLIVSAIQSVFNCTLS